MSVFQIIAVLLTLAALSAFLNQKFAKLPSTISHMAFALLISCGVIVSEKLDIIDMNAIEKLVATIDFSEIVLHGMLSVLLFAGALHINLHALRKAKMTVFILATVGVVLATFITGTLTWWGASLLGISLPFAYALLFGALISPTDPIAVMGILKSSGATESLYTKTGGESLFNDGIAVVIFAAIVTWIQNPESVSPQFLLHKFLFEAIGGIALGLLLGFITFRLVKSVNEHKAEVMLTLALVAGGYALAESIHLSAPICMVVAGLIIGNHGKYSGVSDITRAHIDIFWDLLDDIFNAVLFLLIGFEVIVISVTRDLMLLGSFCVVAVLIGRFLSVGLPISLMKNWKKFDRGIVRILTWGGLRGGVSIALALSLPNGPEKQIILPITYLVVLFSILVQGMTFRRLVQHISSSNSTVLVKDKANYYFLGNHTKHKDGAAA